MIFAGEDTRVGYIPQLNRSGLGANERGAPNLVSTYAVHPGARVLWCLRRKRTDVRCVLFSDMTPIEIQVLHDSDLVIKELFADEAIALTWALEYGDRLRQHGWRDSSEERSPSSAA